MEPGVQRWVLEVRNRVAHHEVGPHGGGGLGTLVTLDGAEANKVDDREPARAGGGGTQARRQRSKWRQKADKGWESSMEYEPRVVVAPGCKLAVRVS